MYSARILLAPLRQKKGRLLVSVLAIALGVALGYAVQLINHSAANEFAQALYTLSGEADLTVRGARGGFDEALYPPIARMPEVAVASPALEVDARLPGHDEPLRVVGLDVMRAGRLQPGLVGDSGDRLDTLRSDTVFLSRPAARLARAEAGRCPGGPGRSGSGAAARRGHVAGRCCASAPRGDGHRRRAVALAAPRPPDADRPASAAGRGLGCVPAAVAESASGRCVRRAPAVHGGIQSAAIARLSDQPQRAGAGGAVYRCAAGVLDASAVGGAAARRACAAARARHDAAAAGATAGHRERIGGCDRCAAGPRAWTSARGRHRGRSGRGSRRRILRGCPAQAASRPRCAW